MKSLFLALLMTFAMTNFVNAQYHHHSSPHMGYPRSYPHVYHPSPYVVRPYYAPGYVPGYYPYRPYNPYNPYNPYSPYPSYQIQIYRW